MKESISFVVTLTGKAAKLVLQKQNELRFTNDTKEKKPKRNLGVITDMLLNEYCKNLNIK